VSQSSLQVSKSVAARGLLPGTQVAWHLAKKPDCGGGPADSDAGAWPIDRAGAGVDIGVGVASTLGGRIGGGVPVGIGAGSRSHSSLQVARSSTDSVASASHAALHPGPFAGPGLGPAAGPAPGVGLAAGGAAGAGSGSIRARICSGSLAASISQSSRHVARLVIDSCDRLHSARQASRLGLARTDVGPRPSPNPARLTRARTICVLSLDMFRSEDPRSEPGPQDFARSRGPDGQPRTWQASRLAPGPSHVG
jgi:hypothetical protein